MKKEKITTLGIRIPVRLKKRMEKYLVNCGKNDFTIRDTITNFTIMAIINHLDRLDNSNSKKMSHQAEE